MPKELFGMTFQVRKRQNYYRIPLATPG